MALIDDINNLPTAVSDGIPGHLNNHQVIHAALKDHETRLSLRHHVGTGSPEGKVAATIGTQYTDQVAATGAIRWIKASGSGSTGWAVDYGDTGWRSLAPVGDYFTGEGVVLFRRIGRLVTIRFGGVGLDTGGNALLYITDAYFIPPGFRAEYVDRPTFWVSNGNANPNYLLTIAQGSRIRYQATSAPSTHPGTGNNSLRGQGSWITDDPWPSTLPGTPA